MKVMVLGSSSGRPTRDRHVAACAVDLDRGWVLVDCGDGTQHQVMRSPLHLGRLDAILLTHLHGDHALGLPSILATMGLEGRTRPLQLVGPRGIAQWLDATAALPLLWVEFPLDITELDEEPAASGAVGVATIHGHRVETRLLAHRVPSFGYRFTSPIRRGRVDVDTAHALGIVDGPDLGRLQRGEAVDVGQHRVTPEQLVGPSRPGPVVAVFGDTMPCPNGVALAADADLLVHEATYSSAHADLAEAYTHSTAAQAAGIAAEAGAARLLITHFSSRHTDSAPLVDEAREVFAATDAAVELEWVEV